MGGWGVDALLGRQTRTHHDLDLLVNASDLPSMATWLRGNGFRRAYEWEENVPVRLGDRTWDTAFVEEHRDGRELDLHAVHVAGHAVRLATTDPWRLPQRPLEGVGTINGRAVACVTADAQRAMHRGYELPETHREDLRRLQQI
jgi:lincosamide nucleotidyltransferase A/C/D/E